MNILKPQTVLAQRQRQCEARRIVQRFVTVYEVDYTTLARILKSYGFKFQTGQLRGWAGGRDIHIYKLAELQRCEQTVKKYWVEDARHL
jgi:inhibitor of KinA sporulation pathway (predicted exonuclease)